MTPELAKAINELILFLVSGLTTIVLPWAFKIGREYALAKISRVKNAEAREALEFALQRLDATAKTVVDEINQRLAARGADGKIAPELKGKLLPTAYTAVLQRLPPESKKLLEDTYGEALKAAVVGKIESKVVEAKAT